MTQEEIIKRSYEVYPEPLNDNYPSTKEYLEAKARAEDKRISYIKGLTEGLRHGHNEGYVKGRKEAFIPAHELSLPKSLDYTTIKGWVARDEFGLMFYRHNPYRVIGTSCSHWTDDLGPNSEWHLPDALFPFLKWEDEPIEVELIIREVK